MDWLNEILEGIQFSDVTLVFFLLIFSSILYKFIDGLEKSVPSDVLRSFSDLLGYVISRTDTKLDDKIFANLAGGDGKVENFEELGEGVMRVVMQLLGLQQQQIEEVKRKIEELSSKQPTE